MEQDQIVNKVLRDMKQFGLISCDENGDVRSGEARFFLNLLWVASYEKRTKELLTHNEKKVVQYDKHDKEIGRFGSIKEAARANRCSRDLVDDSVSGRVSISKKGYYFRYTKDESTL